MDKPIQRNRRDTILIDREFQLRFIGRLAGLLLFYLLLFLVIAIVAPVVFTFLGDPPEWALMETAFRVEVLLRLILAPLVCTFLCLFAHGVLETFKVAGPNFRFKTVFRDMQKLKLPRGASIRKDDYLQPTAKELDAALVALHDQTRSLQENARDAGEKVRAVLARVNSDAARAALAAVTRVEQQLEQFELCGPAPACAPIDAGLVPVVAAAEEPVSASS